MIPSVQRESNMQMKRLRLAVLFSALLLAPAAFGQAVSGTINGLVTDPSGAPVANAIITVLNTRTGVVIKTTTNESGYYSVPHLIPDTYTVTAQAAGFRRYEKTSVVLSVDTTARVDCPLTVGEVKESVTVSAEAAVIKTDKADVGAVISSKTLTDLPVIGRNASQLISILPGALRGGGTWPGENPGFDTNGFVNGQGGGNNYHQLDGIDNHETIQGVAMINPAIDSLQEIKITTNSYDAEFGQVAGAVFQASTKSGGNEYHGSLFEYLQNDKFFARDSFSQATTKVAPYRWNQFGGSLGGPIVKEKLFFFGDWQAMRSRQGSTMQLGVPTPAFKQGDFSAVASQYPIFDPLTGDANGKGRTQFPGNIIPGDRIHPVAAKLAAQLPDPNTADPAIYFRNFVKSGSFLWDTDAVNGRADYNYSQNTRLFVRYTYFRSAYDAPPVYGQVLGGPGFGPQAEVGGTRTQNLSFNFTRVVRPNLFGEFRFGFSRFRAQLAQTDVGLKTANEVGIPGINKGDEMTDGLPEMSWDGPISNLSIGNPYANFYELEQSLQYVTNWSAIVRSHTFKFGADLRPKAKLQRIDKSFRGAFSFSRFGTASADVPGVNGIGFASFLLGYPSSFSRGTYIQLPIEFQNRNALYVQDQWRITPRLTVTLGLRWEYFSPTYSEGDGRLVNFDFATAEMAFANLGGINKHAGVQPDYNNFAPRFGLAYTFTPRTVIRAGYGRSFYINTGGANFGTYCCQWPIGDNQQINAPTLYSTIFPLSQGPPDPTNSQVKVPSTGRLRVPDGQFVMGRPFDDPTSSQDAWNVSLQRQVTGSLSAEIAYVGNVARNQWRPHNANYAVPGPGPLVPRKVYGAGYGLSQWIDMRSNEGNANFNSMQIRVDKRFTKGYQVTAAYTWQKGIVDNYTHPFDRNAYRGPNGPGKWLTISHVVELPFGAGKPVGGNTSGVLAALIDGWQFSGITQFQDGSPFTPGMNANTLNVDYGQRPDRIGSGRVDNPSRDLWFDVTAFRAPDLYTFGNAGTGILHNPGIWYADLALDKNFRFRSPMNESTRLAFRWQLFNAFNHMNLGSPNTTIDAPASQAGHIFRTGATMRRMQLGVHLYF